MPAGASCSSSGAGELGSGRDGTALTVPSPYLLTHLIIQVTERPCQLTAVAPSAWVTWGWHMGSHYQTRSLRGQVHATCAHMPHVCMPRVHALPHGASHVHALRMLHALTCVHTARAGGTKRHRQHASTNSKAGFHARVLPLAAWLSANTGGRAGWSCDPSPDTDPIPNPNPNDPNPNPNPRAGWSCDSGEG